MIQLLNHIKITESLNILTYKGDKEKVDQERKRDGELQTEEKKC